MMNFAESHEPWLGQVPADWNRSRIRNVAVLSPGYSGTPPTADEFCTIVPMELLSEDGGIDVSNQKPAEEAQSGLTLFEQGDVLFAKITPCMENGKGAFVGKLPTRYAFGSTEFHVLRPSRRVDGKFLYYATFNPVFRAYAAENMTGAAGQKRVSSRFLKDTRLFLPLLPEQKLIAAYLDASCAAIDAAVAAKRKQLETLDGLRKATITRAVTQGLDPLVEMQTTDVDWIPKAPKHWRVVRVKDVFDFFNTKRVPLSAAERGMMTEKIYDYYGASGVIDKVEDYLFDGTYILIAEDGANLLNRSKPLAFLASGKFWVNNHAHILKPRWGGDDTFFVNLLECQDYSLFVTGAAQPKLTMENLGRYKIAVPKPAEQRLIAAFVREKDGEFRALPAQIEAQIETLTAYRKSLIHECVTGQRRITEADLKQMKAHG
ncbi:MAG: restriction endonuclease subunit S [Blastocatellia bacterium]|nr:restriction endonuclease subunit S [Blastocatellia bacterium]